MTKESKTYNLIRLDDRLIYHGSYYLDSRPLRLLCYVIAKYVDPHANTLPSQLRLSFKEISNALNEEGAKWGSLYQEISEICKQLTSSPIQFRSGVQVDGLELSGYINWCAAAIPVKDEEGHKYVHFEFGSFMSQFLVGLAQYVRLYRPELNRLKRSHAIRLFQMLKGIRNRRGKYEQVSIESYGVEELKFLFGIEDKYPQFKHFNNQVIKRSVEEINAKTSIHILQVKSVRNNKRQVISLEFHFSDREPLKPFSSVLSKEKKLTDYFPTSEEVASLTWAKREAYDKLIAFGVKEGIAFRQLLSTIKGSEFEGFEDYFVKYALQHFKQWAKQQQNQEVSAATFVHWWTNKKVFDTSSDVWSKMVERVVKDKKKLEAKEPIKFANRKVAAEMTEEAFKDWYRKQQQD